LSFPKGICFFLFFLRRCLFLPVILAQPESLSLPSPLPVLARHSALSATEGQNLRIPLDAQIPQYPPVRALNPSIDKSSLTYE
jgi:hypothetical protein